jgi:hypothetical protein
VAGISYPKPASSLFATVLAFFENQEKHMIRISANMSKKVPIPDKAYSSQAFGASIEIEVSDAMSFDVIHERIRHLYTLLGQSIDEQLTEGQNGVRNGILSEGPPETIPSKATASRNGSSRARFTYGSVNCTNGNGATAEQNLMATKAQCRAITAICKTLSIDVAALMSEYNVSDPSQLTIKTASELITELRNRQDGRDFPSPHE